jgi:DNA-binding NarL/FixJ family response regulator
MRVLVVDNHTLFRQGLMELLSNQPDMTVVGEAGDSWEAVTETRRLSPDLILFEPNITWGNGLEALRKIREEAPDIKFLVLTISEDEEDLWQALKGGAHGYLLKSTTPEQLFRAIRDVMKGEITVSPSLAGKVLREQLFGRGEKGGNPQAGLTPREREILALLSTGVSDKEIGSQLRLSASTVRHHVHSILRKLRLKNRVQAAVFGRSQEPRLSYNWEDVK